MRTHFSSLPFSLLLLLAGCGGSPTTPTSPAPTPPVSASLQPGAYYLVISQGSNTVPSPVGDGRFSTWICLGVGSYPTTVQVPVNVEGEGGNYLARAVSGSLVLNIAVSGGAASGTVQGNADDGTGTFSISVQGAEPAGVSGSVSGDRTVAGSVQGRITLSGPQGYGGCSPASWGLVPR